MEISTMIANRLRFSIQNTSDKAETWRRAAYQECFRLPPGQSNRTDPLHPDLFQLAQSGRDLVFQNSTRCHGIAAEDEHKPKLKALQIADRSHNHLVGMQDTIARKRASSQTLRART
jgi:hypothetical protein